MIQTLSCTITEKLLHPYIDGMLSAPERQTVEQHVAGCRACRQAFVSIERTVLALESLQRPVAPAGLLAGTMRSVRAVHRAQHAPSRWQPLGTVAVVLLAVLGVVAHAGASGQPLVTALDTAVEDPATLLQSLAFLGADAELPLLMATSVLLVLGAVAFTQLLRGEFTTRAVS